jgi:hypothetical protein
MLLTDIEKQSRLFEPVSMPDILSFAG